MSAQPLLSVARTRDGIWSVNERGPSRVAVLEAGGAVQVSRDYDQGPEAHRVETP